MGIVGTLLPHSCKLSRDWFYFSREYFLLWVIKTSLDRNMSALPDPKVLFHFISLIESLSFNMLKSYCESSLSEDIGQCDFFLLQVIHMSSVCRLKLVKQSFLLPKCTRRSWHLAAWYLQTSRILEIPAAECSFSRLQKGKWSCTIFETIKH